MRLFEDNENTELNITPLIDIVFILLIFFMLSTVFVENKALNIDLPEAKTSESSVDKEILNISIEKDGNIYIGGEVQKIESIKDFAKKTKEKKASIKADEKVEHGKVIKVMDELRKSGIFNISIETRL